MTETARTYFTPETRHRQTHPGFQSVLVQAVTRHTEGTRKAIRLYYVPVAILDNKTPAEVLNDNERFSNVWKRSKCAPFTR